MTSPKSSSCDNFQSSHFCDKYTTVIFRFKGLTYATLNISEICIQKIFILSLLLHISVDQFPGNLIEVGTHFGFQNLYLQTRRQMFVVVNLTIFRDIRNLHMLRISVS